MANSVKALEGNKKERHLACKKLCVGLLVVVSFACLIALFVTSVSLSSNKIQIDTGLSRSSWKMAI